MKCSFAKQNWLSLILVWILCFTAVSHLHAGSLQDLKKKIGKKDAIFVADPQGNVLLSKNADQQRIPASTLKILTSLVALHYLGEDFRFVTEFYMDQNSNLKIKGYGDPLLVSEVLSGIAKTLSTKLQGFNDLILDHSYFDPILIPGVTTTLNPYDAPNGALCVNFNTVNFRRAKGGYVSAEPQTPLLPFAIEKIRKFGHTRGRVIFSREQDEITLYAGHLFRYFFREQGLHSEGKIRIGKIRKESDTHILTYTSEFTMEDVISKLLEYSNNFIANQVLAATGAKMCSPPGTLEKGVRVASAFVQDILKLENITIDEGSGISRKNRISAKNLCKLLEKFEPYRHLMRHEGREFYKTGSLTGVKTRAGYIEKSEGERYRFVVMINTPGKSAKAIMSALLKALP
ncbi:MAG: hypothetical protein B6245_12575 [Desulfobacteraceae bacterium 4572_88]|nr:MAG: hypothetical protein B6245_12575 [Desulfobacteraceae bacterium 4572_88]RLC02286.1 MAG: D-alanyl-D-alanine carboxypeptidase [Deltaproteobacteria bacterium]